MCKKEGKIIQIHICSLGQKQHKKKSEINDMLILEEWGGDGKYVWGVGWDRTAVPLVLSPFLSPYKKSKIVFHTLQDQEIAT